MSALARVREVTVTGARELRVVFTDGLVRELDFTGVLAGVLAVIDSDEAFAAAGVDVVAGTVSWPQGVDFDPDVLHGDAAPASASAPRLVREYRLEHTV
ncbi:MAG: DUF2442 domain-containing protein [Acidimicrobiia bacterium]|jgi:Protein of unknown function (DUF2442)|nr:DUF2442 domain-containing protein [Acidimicrobiia bacterium]MDH4354351.1 DUF2442 domain-containing protein [Actinomycetota bacterium]